MLLLLNSGEQNRRGRYAQTLLGEEWMVDYIHETNSHEDPDVHEQSD